MESLHKTLRDETRRKIIVLLLFVGGFLVAPFIGVGMLFIADTFNFSGGIQPLILGGSISGYLLLYMILWFWLKKKVSP